MTRRFTDEQEDQIRKAYAQGGVSQAALARQWGCSDHSIRLIVVPGLRERACAHGERRVEEDQPGAGSRDARRVACRKPGAGSRDSRCVVRGQSGTGLREPSHVGRREPDQGSG